MTHVTWQCECSLVEAKVPASGNRIICYCESCREFVAKLGCADRLDDQGGNELLQAQPKEVTITKGTERLVYTRLTEKGPARWYARCCNTPMANTLTTRALPFASFQVHDLEPKDALPPILGAVNLSGATGRVDLAERMATPTKYRRDTDAIPTRKIPSQRRTALRFVASVLGTAVSAYLTGKVKQNPFFDASGAPIGPRQDII